MNTHNIYLATDGRWRDKSTGKMAPSPFIKRCEVEGCENRVRGKKQKFCSQHIDWTKTAHGSSILTDSDVVFISSNYQQMSDKELTDKLILEAHHNGRPDRSLLLAIRHHRRKYLMLRYEKKFYYKTIKEKYRKQHPSCEICDWTDGGVDVHHLWQIKDFENEVDYHKSENLISLCPNHHRFVEDMRRKDKDSYIEFIAKYGR
jgi:hypothetical protein